MDLPPEIIEEIIRVAPFHLFRAFMFSCWGYYNFCRAIVWDYIPRWTKCKKKKNTITYLLPNKFIIIRHYKCGDKYISKWFDLARNCYELVSKKTDFYVYIWANETSEKLKFSYRCTHHYLMNYYVGQSKMKLNYSSDGPNKPYISIEPGLEGLSKLSGGHYYNSINFVNLKDIKVITPKGKRYEYILRISTIFYFTYEEGMYEITEPMLARLSSKTSPYFAEFIRNWQKYADKLPEPLGPKK